MPKEKKTGDAFDDWKGLVEDFKKQKILAFLPGEREYELSCSTANLLYRFTRPFFVIQPETWAEVLTVVDTCYTLKLHGKLTVKCGGHSYTGFSTVDQGIIVDMKRMNAVHLEFDDDTKPNKRPEVAVIQAGALWGDVYRSLIRRDCRGYVVNGGRCPSVGVGGFILGGGLSPFGRSLGLGSDTLIGATIITLKDKKVVKLDVTWESDKELLWALRGGGTAAFGIVTEFRMQVCKLQNKNVDQGVTACRYAWAPHQKYKDIIKPKHAQKREDTKAAEDAALFKTMDAFYAADWPPEMTIDSNWMLEMAGDKGKLSIRFTLYFDGPESECDDLLDKHIKDPELLVALKRRTIPEPSTRFLHETLFLMWEEEARMHIPRTEENQYQLWCSFVFDGDAKKMAQLIRYGKSQQDQFEKDFQNDKAGLWVTFIHSGGKMKDKGSDATSAYPWRDGVFQCSILLKFTDKWLEKTARITLLKIKEDMQKYALTYDKVCGSYVNFADATLATHPDPHTANLKAYYGNNGDKLVKLKKERDPDNFFKWPWQTDTQIWKKELDDANKAQAASIPSPAGVAPASIAMESAAMEPAAELQTTEEMVAEESTTKPAAVGASAAIDKAAEAEAKAEAAREDLAKKWTDLIASRSWDNYELPPPAYTELGAPAYLHLGSPA